MNPWYHRFHLCKVSHQCECEYVYSGRGDQQTGHRTCHIYNVSLQCEYERAVSGHCSVETGQSTCNTYKGFI